MTSMVFVHGIKGGQLRGPGGQLRWVSRWQALGLDRRRLALPLHYDGRGQLRDGLEADGALTSVFGVPIYRPFLEWAAARGDVHAFGYDWRRNPAEAVERLEACLRETVDRTGEPVDVVAHSMGGLITFLALRRCAEQVRSVVFAGVPFGTGVGFAEDMHLGARTGLNGRVLDRQTHASWSSPWWFFPTHGDSRVRDRHGAMVDMDWYDPACWRSRELGVYAAEVEPDMVVHHGRAMHNARTLRGLLSDPGAMADAAPKIALLVGRGTSCIHTILSDDRRWDFAGGERNDGDGRVSADSATLPVELPHRRWETSLVHDRMLDDSVALDEIFSWIEG